MACCTPRFCYGFPGRTCRSAKPGGGVAQETDLQLSLQYVSSPHSYSYSGCLLLIRKVCVMLRLHRWVLFWLLWGRWLVSRLDLWVLSWVGAVSSAVLGNHGWQQKKNEFTHRFGGCKSGTQRKAAVGWACSDGEMTGLETGLRTLKESD